MSHPEVPGGSGGESAPNTRETRLHARAIEQRWPMSPAIRVKVLKRLCKIVDEDADHGELPPPGHREVIAASRALLAADRLNLDQERLDLQAPADAGADDYVIDLSADDLSADPDADAHAQQADGPSA